MIKRIGNDKMIIDDKELKKIAKESYDRGLIFGSKTTSSVMIRRVNEMAPENLEEIKSELVKFSDGGKDI